MEFTASKIRSICLGKFSAKKCPCCDNDGIVYFDGNTGLGVGPTPPGGLQKEDIGIDTCDNCFGVGFILTIQD